MMNEQLATIFTAIQSIDFSKLRMEDVHEFNIAKRAFEVALAGNHSMGLVGNNEGQKIIFSVWAQRYGVTLFTARPCPCGNYGSTVRVCYCTEHEVVMHRAENKSYLLASNAEIVIQTTKIDVDKLLSKRMGEKEMDVVDRAKHVRNFLHEAPKKHDETATRLIKSAVSQMGLDTLQVMIVESVARTIEALSIGSGRVSEGDICATSVAEALQYRPNRSRD